MMRGAIVLTALALAGCAGGLDGSGGNGSYVGGYGGSYGYGPPPFSSAPYGPPPGYYERPAYYGAPAYVYEGRGRGWDDDRGRGYGQENPAYAQQRQQALINQQQQYNQQVSAAQQRYNQQVSANPLGAAAYRDQLAREGAVARQKLEQDSRYLRQ